VIRAVDLQRTRLARVFDESRRAIQPHCSEILRRDFELDFVDDAPRVRKHGIDERSGKSRAARTLAHVHAPENAFVPELCARRHEQPGYPG